MIELKKTEGRTPAQNQQVGLAKKILEGELNGGKTNDGVQITPGNVYMAKMIAEPKQSALSAKFKFLEPAPSGTAVAFVTMASPGQNGTELVNFCRRGMVVLTSEIDVDKQKGYLAANEKGVFAIVAKPGWNITDIMTRNFNRVTNPDQTVILNNGLDIENISMLPVSGLTVEALFQKTLEESKANPFKFASTQYNDTEQTQQKVLSAEDNYKALLLVHPYDLETSVPTNDQADLQKLAVDKSIFGVSIQDVEEAIIQYTERAKELSSSDPITSKANQTMAIALNGFLNIRRDLENSLGTQQGDWQQEKGLGKNRPFKADQAKFRQFTDQRMHTYELIREALNKPEVKTSTEIQTELEANLIDFTIKRLVINWFSKAKFTKDVVGFKASV